MKSLLPHTRASVFAGLAALASFFPAQANAFLQWDLRAVSVSAGGVVVDAKTVTLDGAAVPGAIVTLELWAVVIGIDGIVNEQFQSGIGMLASSPGTIANRELNVNGNLALPNLTLANLIYGNLSNALLPTWQTGAFSNGNSVDLDGDGDLDVGATSTATTVGHLVARAPSIQDGTGLSPGDFHTLSNGREFKISLVTFAAQTFSGDDAKTALNFVVPRFTSSLTESTRALSNSDGGASENGSDINLSVAAPVIVNVKPVPEPSCAALIMAGLGVLGLRRRPQN